MPTSTLARPQTVAPKPQAAPQTIAPLSASPQGEPRKRLLSAHDYMKMAEIGLFDGQRVELIGGDVTEMPPISEDHAQSVDKSTKKFNRTLDESIVVRGQNPFNAGENGRPEPDIAIVRPEAIQPSEPPSQAVLLVEVSRSTLEYDRTTKASLYASLGIADYWIVNLIEQTVEVRRQPIELASAQFGWDYASRQIYQRGQSIALLEVPGVSILVDEMLP